jgi:hypothetical protein
LAVSLKPNTVKSIFDHLGRIGFEWFSAHAEGFLKAVGRKPSGEGASVVLHTRTLRQPLDIETHRASCAAPLSFADYLEMQLHQCPNLTVLGLRRSALKDVSSLHDRQKTNQH